MRWGMILIVVVASIPGIGLGVINRMQNEYHRGFTEGVASVTSPDIDKQCVGWMFESNFKDAKKRICK